MMRLFQSREFSKGFILLPVVFTLSILATASYLLSREGAINAGNVNREQQQDAALYVAQAGYSHAIWSINRKNCTGYADIPATAIGAHHYLATYTDIAGSALTAGSPANIKVIGTLASGASYTINRSREKIYHYPLTTVTLQLGTDPGKDAGIHSFFFFKDLNYGNYKQEVLSSYTTIHQLIQFDLSAIPTEANIVSAQLELKQSETTSADADAKISVHRIKQDWVEGTKEGGGTADGATWKTSDGSQSWDDGGGGSYDATPIASTVITSDKIVRNWDISALVQDWHTGQYANEGLLLKGSEGVSVSFASKEDATVVDRPKLTITYACECGKTCLSAAKKIYWTDDDAEVIKRSDEDGGNVETIITGQYKVRGLDIDTVNGKIYWTSDDFIRRANLNGSNIETIFTTSSELNFDVKLDVTGGKMYWTYDNTADQIMRSNLDGSNVEMINSSTNDPLYFSLDVDAGFIYVTENGGGDVSRMSLDGSGATQLISGSGSAMGNAIDTVNGKIYWTGGSANDWIKRADLDGSNEEIIVTGLNAPQDIAYDATNSRIYWTDGLSSLIQRANADGSNMETIVSTGLLRPRGIAVVNADDVNPLPPPCSGTFRDEFNNRVYSGSDGTLNWTGDWLEINESDGPLDNDERVFEDTYEDPPMPTYQLHVRDNDGGGEGVMRALNMSGANTATLSFDYKPYGLDTSSDYASVQMSTTGTVGPWTEVVRFAGPASETAYQFYSADISDYISSDSALRIITSSGMGASDYVFFDNIQIECQQ